MFISSAIMKSSAIKLRLPSSTTNSAVSSTQQKYLFNEIFQLHPLNVYI